MKYIYYKDDFKVTLEFKDGDTPTPLDNVDFRGKLYTAYDKYSEGIPFSRINGDVIGCDIGENGSLTIVADNHGFKAGKLMVDMKYYIYDSEYPDGKQTIARTYDLKVWLTTSQKLADGERPIEVNAIINLPLEVIVQQVKDLTEKGEQIVADADTAIANVNTAIGRANTAAESVEDAVTSANNAANKADTAANNVNTAIESANSAAQRANIAADNANSAIEAANTATSKANAAAEEAKTSATTASQAAAQATTAAQAANTAADNANTAADSASEYVERYNAIAGALPKVTDTFEGVAQDTGLRYVIRKNKLIAMLKDGHVQYAPEGLAYVDAIAPTSFVYGTKTYEVPAGVSYVEFGQPALTSVGAILKDNAGIRAFGLYSDTSKNTSLGLVFANAADLEWLDVSAMDTSAVTYGYAIFRGSTKLREIVGKLDLSSATRIDSCFSGCTALERVDIQPITAVCTTVANAFSGCSSLTALDVSSWDLSKVATMSQFCRGCKSLKTLVLPTASNPMLTNISLFLSGIGLESVDINDFDVSAVTEMPHALSTCPNLREVIIPNWHAPNLTNTSGLFASNPLLKRIDISGLTMDKVTNVTYMFLRCYALTSLKFPNMGQLKADSDNNKTIGFSDDPLDRASLDSIFSYDRTANGLTNPLTVQLSKASKALLSAEDIAAITAKGYTIV